MLNAYEITSKLLTPTPFHSIKLLLTTIGSAFITSNINRAAICQNTHYLRKNRLFTKTTRLFNKNMRLFSKKMQLLA